MDYQRGSLRWTVSAAFVLAAACVVIASGAASGRTSSDEDRARETDASAANVAVVLAPGPLVISADEAPLILDRMPGSGGSTRYRGRLPRIRIVDTRSTLAGWQVTVRILAPDSLSTAGSRLQIRPDRPRVLAGQIRGVRASRPVWSALGEQVSLFSADQGFGNGAYDDDALVELVLQYPSSATTITLPFEASVL